MTYSEIGAKLSSVEVDGDDGREDDPSRDTDRDRSSEEVREMRFSGT